MNVDKLVWKKNDMNDLLMFIVQQINKNET